MPLIQNSFQISQIRTQKLRNFKRKIGTRKMIMARGFMAPSNLQSLLVPKADRNTITFSFLFPHKTHKKPHFNILSNSSSFLKERDALCAFALKKRESAKESVIEVDDFEDELDFDDEDGNEIGIEDGDNEDDGDEGFVLPLENMRTWLENKPLGFGEGKAYDTTIEDKLFEDIEQSKVAQLVNINKLKNNPVQVNSKEKQQKLQKVEAAPFQGLEASSSSGLVGQNDLLIVGPGVLGRLVAEKWRQEHPDCQICAQTASTDHHDDLISIGISPSLKEVKPAQQFPYVIFCAPPSQTADYPGDVRLAISNWNSEGSFLFTSSTAPYDCNDNGECDENCPVVPIGKSPRVDILLNAEKVVTDSDGCVLRLAGLYKADRGAHFFWLKKGVVESRPDHILNLIHYEDAASLAVSILKKRLRGQILLGCDNHPLSRQELMDLVNKSGKFDKKFDRFTGSNDPLGKRLNNSKTRLETGWEPKYPSFAHFLEGI